MSKIGAPGATVRVTAIEGNRISIQQDCFGTQRSGEDPCFGCLKTECKTPSRIITLENTENLCLREGDPVKIEAKPALVFFQTLSALGPPVLGFLAGFFLPGLLFPDSNDPARAAAGVLLMFTAAFGFYQLRRRVPAKNPFRIIIKT